MEPVITAKILSDRTAIEQSYSQCAKLAIESNCAIPFQYLQMPSVWWNNFSSNDGQDFALKRGFNFLGSQSWLRSYQLFTVTEGEAIVGAVPMVSYSVKIPGEQELLNVFTFPGDYLSPYHDFTVSAAKRKDVIRTLLDSMIELLDDQTLIIFHYLPDNSPNIGEIKRYLGKLSKNGITYKVAMTGRKGGVRPWTIAAIVSYLKRMDSKISEPALGTELKMQFKQLIDELESCPPTHLMFSKTRSLLEEKIRSVLAMLPDNTIVHKQINLIESLLRDGEILYPYIDLPSESASYIGNMTSENRRYFLRYKRRFEKEGGTFEKIASSEITPKDMEDYLRLHNLRWSRSSAFMINDSTHRFLSDLSMQLRRDGFLTLFFANFQGRRIATQSCIDILGRREGFMMGRDPQYAKLSAGRVLFFESIIDAIDGGFHTYDLGLGWFDYKMKLATGFHHTVNFFISSADHAVDFAKLFLGYESMIAV